jgi:hypothetical protein
MLIIILIIISDLCAQTQSSQFNSRRSTYSNQYSEKGLNLDWYSYGNSQILFSEQKVPRSIVHFIGGFITGSAASVTYSNLLGAISEQGHLVVATNISPFSSNHDELAYNASSSFLDCYNNLLTKVIGPDIRNVPVVGLSHSLGGKLTALLNSNKRLRRILPRKIGNIYLAFNNYDIDQSLELSKKRLSSISPDLEKIFDITTMTQSLIQTLSQTAPVSDFLESNNQRILPNLQMVKDSVENQSKKFSSLIDEVNNFKFQPSRLETWARIREGYNVNKNVLFKFENDEIDQSLELEKELYTRGCEVIRFELPGDHLTPNTLSTKNSSNKFLRYLLMSIDRLILDFEEETSIQTTSLLP